MPEQPARTVDLLAELHLEIDGPAGFTHVHLSGGPQQLVVEVDDPAAVLAASPGLRTLVRLVRSAPGNLPAGLRPDLRVSVRSGGRELASVCRVGDGLAFRPTLAGASTVAGVVVHRIGRTSLVAATAATAVVLAARVLTSRSGRRRVR